MGPRFLTEWLDSIPMIQCDKDCAVALSKNYPVVALESSVIAQGLPAPHNRQTAFACETILREMGVVPATIAVIDGAVKVGLTADEIDRLASDTACAKLSRRDLAVAQAQGRTGGTTVAATLAVAAQAGISVFATGGIGGVHRGGEGSLDVSADLIELGRSPAAVVASGAKTILDLPRTLEVLETQGVPVVGYQTDVFPAFTCRGSGLPLTARVESPDEAAAVMRRHWELGGGGLLFANPIPRRRRAAAGRAGGLDRLEAEARSLGAAGIAGQAVTPFLLARLAEISGGRTLRANIALLKHNARVAGQIAAAYAAERLCTLRRPSPPPPPMAGRSPLSRKRARD